MSQGKVKGSSVRFQLEEQLAEAKPNLDASLDRYSILEAKTELVKALTWTSSPQSLAISTIQDPNSWSGLESYY